ncbi:MAG TPA: tetratricopeptide repeat protein [Thermoanaerobaculia bacterium]|nr:tetratricopeptide repeat protein [Thermoanaerobaculia bacterium]
MRVRIAVTGILLFVLGLAVGVAFAKKIELTAYKDKPKKEAAKALLVEAERQAGKGSWERIAVGRIYYLGGMKKEGQEIFDSVLSRKPASSDLFRIARVYYEANEWSRSKELFEKYLAKHPKDDKGLAEVGAYYLLKGDRAKAEELFERSFRLEEEVWSTVNAAGAYLGVPPQP